MGGRKRSERRKKARRESRRALSVFQVEKLKGEAGGWADPSQRGAQAAFWGGADL